MADGTRTRNPRGKRPQSASVCHFRHGHQSGPLTLNGEQGSQRARLVSMAKKSDKATPTTKPEPERVKFDGDWEDLAERVITPRQDKPPAREVKPRKLRKP